MVCVRLPGSTLLRKILDVSWGATRGSIASGITIDAQPYSTPCFLCPGTGESISPTAIFVEPLLKIAVRGDRLCSLVAGLLDAIVMAHNLLRTNRGLGLNFQSTYGRIQDDDGPPCVWRVPTPTRRCAWGSTRSSSNLKPSVYWSQHGFVLCCLLAELLPE